MKPKRLEECNAEMAAGHIEQLGDMRDNCTDQLALLQPFCDDYNALSNFIAQIDKHQVKWTKDPEYFWSKGANHICKAPNDN